MIYANFWYRFCASMLDAILLLPLFSALWWLQRYLPLIDLYWLLPGIAFHLWFYYYLVLRHGGTPGKLLMKMRIVMLDGSPVTQRAAALRCSVTMLLLAGDLLASAIASTRMPVLDNSGDSLQSLVTMQEKLTPAWHMVVYYAENFWFWSEVIVVLFNRRRRAPHDYMAGTVVIRTAAAPMPA